MGKTLCCLAALAFLITTGCSETENNTVEAEVATMAEAEISEEEARALLLNDYGYFFKTDDGGGYYALDIYRLRNDFGWEEITTPITHAGYPGIVTYYYAPSVYLSYQFLAYDEKSKSPETSASFVKDNDTVGYELFIPGANDYCRTGARTPVNDNSVIILKMDGPETGITFGAADTVIDVTAKMMVATIDNYSPAPAGNA